MLQLQQRHVKFGGRLKSPRRVLLKRPEDGVVERQRQARLNREGSRRRLPDLIDHDRESARAVERLPAGGELIQHRAERVDVAPCVQRRRAPYLLRRHVVKRVGQLHDARVGDQNIGRRHVAVDHATPVRAVERRERLASVVNRGRQRDPALLQHAAQRAALDQLHHQNQVLTGPESVMDGGDVGVVQAGLKLNFAQGSRGLLGLAGPATFENLHRLQPPGDGVLDLVDPAHAAVAQLFKDSIRVDSVSDGEGHRSRPSHK